MIPYVRQENIVKFLAERDVVYLEELMSLLKTTSESTLRRDLKKLESENRIILLHGGGIRLNCGFEADVTQKLTENILEKERIAAYAADKVRTGDVIYLDSSTTVIPMLRFLKEKAITVVTSSTFISEYMEGSSFTCIIVGGEIKKSTGSVVGPLAENMLSQIRFNKAFIGSNGYSAQTGVNTPDLREAQKKKIVKSNSDETFFLMDSSKLNVNTMCKVFELNECRIITEAYNPLLEEFLSYEIAGAR